MSLLEVHIALAVLAVMLLSAGIAFSSSMRSMRTARDLTGAAVFLGHGDPQPPRISHGAVEFEGEVTAFIPGQPIGIIEASAHPIDVVDDGVLLVVEVQIHDQRVR